MPIIFMAETKREKSINNHYSGIRGYDMLMKKNAVTTHLV